MDGEDAERRDERSRFHRTGSPGATISRTVPVGRRVVVIGGGNTAVDAAVQSRKLGATSVTMVYRRGVEHMSATWAEREFAQTNGVTLVTHARPVRLIGVDGM